MEKQCLFCEAGTGFLNVYINFVLQRFNSLWISVDFCPVANRRRLTLTSSRQNVGKAAGLFHTIFELTSLCSQYELCAMFSGNFCKS
jgi:hypothetical protein